MRKIVLGAGFTGMAAGIKTGLTIYEASNNPGGICKSYVKDGFQFSQGGGHWVFGKGAGYDYINSQVPLNKYERKAGTHYNHTFPYPIQTAAQKTITAKEGTLKGWLVENFSKAECNLFFNPFNDKYTCGLYEDVIQYDEYKTPPAGSVGFVSTFSDPVGGLNVLVDKMASQCSIKYGKRAIKVNTEAKSVLFEDGEVIWYDKLISTIPLNILLAICGKEDYRLPYTSVLVINIGAEKTEYTPEEHWLYEPFCNSGFYRIGFYSNVDKSKAPEGMVSLSVEMAFRGIEYKDLNVEAICKDVIKELKKWRFIGDGDVKVIDPTWVKTAYTWLYDKDDANIQIEWLKRRDILSIGRYGAWKFQGMTQSIADGLGVEV